MNILVLLLNYVLHRTNKNAFCAKRKANEREYKMNWTRDTKANRQLKRPAHKIRKKKKLYYIYGDGATISYKIVCI